MNAILKLCCLLVLVSAIVLPGAAAAVDVCFNLGGFIYVAKAFGSLPTRGVCKTARGFTTFLPSDANFTATICTATNGSHLRGSFTTTLANNEVIWDQIEIPLPAKTGGVDHFHFLISGDKGTSFVADVGPCVSASLPVP